MREGPLPVPGSLAQKGVASEAPRSGETCPPTQRQVDIVLLSASSKQTAGWPIRARRNRSSYWPSSHLPFTKIRRTQCPTGWVPASSPARGLLQPLVWITPETFAPRSPRSQHLHRYLQRFVPRSGPILTKSHTRMPCHRSCGTTKLEALSQTDWALTVHEATPQF